MTSELNNDNYIDNSSNMASSENDLREEKDVDNARQVITGESTSG